MSELAANVMQFMMYLFEAFCIQKLFYGFLQPRWKNQRLGEITTGIIWILVRYAAGILLTGTNGRILIGRLFIYVAGIFCFSLMWYKAKTQWKMFLVILFVSLRELSFFAGYGIFIMLGGWLTDVLVYGFEHRWIPEGIFLNTVYIVTDLSLLGMVFSEGILLYGAIRMILNIYDHKVCKRTDRELIFYMLPAVAGLLITIMLRSSMFVEEEKQWILLFDRYPSLKFIIPCISLVLLASIVFNFWLYQKMSEQNEKEKERQILKNQIVQMQSAMQEMERLYDGIRSVRHDMKNQMLTLRGILPKEGEGIQGLKDFVSDMYHSVEQLDYGIHTGNSVCDVVIGSKFACAKEKLRPVCLDAEHFAMPDVWEIRAYDMGIMLNNGLDNAIEAIERMRGDFPEKEAYILVRSYVRGTMVFVEIENSFNGVLQFEKGSHIPISQKEGGCHGIGLANIRNCARKYGGEVDCIVEEDRFILSIMLKGGKI